MDKNYETATLESRLESGALVICVKGIVTLDTMHAMRAETFRWVVMTETKRLLCDLGSAVITLTDDEWGMCAEEQGSEHAVAIPTAMLVPEAVIGRAWRYCDKLNTRGRSCIAFKNAEFAYLWADVPMTPRPSPRGSRSRLRETRDRLQRRAVPGQ